MCGSQVYERGKVYYQGRKVNLIHYEAGTSSFEAVVHGSSPYTVKVAFRRNTKVKAECTCPAFSTYPKYCKHIAAVLILLQQKGKEQSAETGNLGLGRSYPSLLYTTDGITAGFRPDAFQLAAAEAAAESIEDELRISQVAERIIDVFSDGGRPARPLAAPTLIDSKIPLTLEIICKPSPNGFQGNSITIELKVGPNRPYVVPRIRDFLDKVELGQCYVFSKHFTYDPQQHHFLPESAAVLKHLIQVHHTEQMYRKTGYYPHGSRSLMEERGLSIPPSLWDSLAALLVQTPEVYVEQNGKSYKGIQLSDEPLPLLFELDQAVQEDLEQQEQQEIHEKQEQQKKQVKHEVQSFSAASAQGTFKKTSSEVYELGIQGLDKLTVMEAYGVVLAEGKLIPVQPEQCKRLLQLKQTIDAYRNQQLLIPADQVEPFMEKVVPGLTKLGRVRIAQAVSDRIVQLPLKAKLYLDRVKHRLLAGLEFHYGDLIIHPLQPPENNRSRDQILMREGEKERRILQLMEQSAFSSTEGGYFMEDEEGEYEFLYHIVPELEKLATIYATSAVKVRLHTVQSPPKITVDVDERTDWLEFRFDMEGISESDIRHVLKSLEEKRKYYKLPNGALLPLETAEFQEMIRVMNDVGVRMKDVRGTKARLPVANGLQLMDLDLQDKRSSIRLGPSFRRLLDNMRNPDQLDFPIPGSLSPILRDYQKYGFQWLKTLAHYRFGGILADDMGLGKTLQSIAMIVSVLPEIREQKLPVLIVAPASLIYNWRKELNKFAPDIRAAITDGSPTERVRVLQNPSEADVIITSYPLLRKDITRYSSQTFHTLILDEAQAFKNHATQTAQAVKTIQARHRFALTGTPIENSLEELWSIYNVVFPGLFPGKKAFNELSRETVARRIRPFLLRRLKSEVLKELPDKIESLQVSELLPEQKKLYAAYLAKLRQEALKHLDKDTLRKNRIRILAGLTRLRQLCCHPALFIEGYEGSSSKFEQLLDIVEECRSAGKRMLIFSQFTQMLGLIASELSYRGSRYFYLDGGTPPRERVELCDRFNDGERELFLISLKAGGTGLNLTGADVVVLYDLWWNPAVEEQAADRAYRIGQKNVVQVIRLVAQGTVEEKMYALQQRKKSLIEEVIQPGQESLSALTEQEILDLLNVKE